MQTLIGPILSRHDGYAFDTWTRAAGLSRGFGYRRIEDAYYARKAAFADETRAGGPGALLCNTLDAFTAEIQDAAIEAAPVWQVTAPCTTAPEPALAA